MPSDIQRGSVVPKYVELADQLRVQVRRGHLKPGDQLPSFAELRDRYQVSRGTVEKVHTLLEQDGLIKREQGRGVFVAPAQQRTVTGLIGLSGGGMAETDTSLYWAHLLSGLREEATRSKMQLLLFDVSDTTAWDKVDGVLLSHGEDNLYQLLHTMPTDLPRVSVLVSAEEESCVRADDYQGAYDLTQHLLSLGHRRIGFVVGDGRDSTVAKRMEGYQAALQGAGIEPSLRWVRHLRLQIRHHDSKSEFVEQGRRTVTQWLREDWQGVGCTALMCQNDHVAVGAIQALQEGGLQVPNDVSVTGFDGTEMYAWFSPRLTTVEVPLRKIGMEAVRMLVTRIQKPESPAEEAILPTHLRVEASTAPPPP